MATTTTEALKGSFSLAGEDIVGRNGATVSLSTGTFPLVGRGVPTVQDQTLICTKGSFTLTGQDTNQDATKRLTAIPKSFKITPNRNYGVATFPFNIAPLRDSYNYKVSSAARRYTTEGDQPRYAKLFGYADQVHSVAYNLTHEQLATFDSWYYNTIHKGALPFKLLLNSGTGLKTHTVWLVPNTLRVLQGTRNKLTFDIKVKPSVLDEYTEATGKTFVDTWNSQGYGTDIRDVNYTPTYPLSAPTSTIQRFDPEYWNINLRLGSSGAVIKESSDQFTVYGAFRSNLDLISIIWDSEDRYGHPCLRYDTVKDYTDTVFAFLANPADPYNFSITMTVEGVDYVYRLFPYKLTGTVVECDITDPTTQGTGTGLEFDRDTIFPDGYTASTGYHIYVIDFNNLWTGFNFDETRIDHTNISTMFFAFICDDYGIGLNAVLADETAADVSQFHITGVPTGFRLNTGDVLQVSYTQGGDFITEDISVTTWSGDGTTERFIDLPSTRYGVTWTGAGVLAKTLTLDSPVTGGNVDTSITFKNIATTGDGATIGKYNLTQPAHDLYIATGFDNVYVITPQRWVNQVYALGYRGRVVNYVGASHYYKCASYVSGGVYYNRIDETQIASPINLPTQYWLTSYFQELYALSYECVLSFSMEILQSNINPDWAQKDVDDTLAATGYTPPTTFLEMNVPDAQTYIENVFKQGMDLMTAEGLPPLMQMGEFWWWDGSYTNLKPCIYAYATKLAYYNDTGTFAPTTITNVYQTLNAAERAYCTWLGNRLGAFTHEIRDAIKAHNASAEVTLLFFSPQIFAEGSEALPLLNFPSTYWAYPEFDFMQIEAYDWVIFQTYERLPLTFDLAVQELGYPVDKIDYFVGFVNSSVNQHIWQGMSIDTQLARNYGINSIVVWAYTQVIRDGIIVNTQKLPDGCMPVFGGGYERRYEGGVAAASDVYGAVTQNALVYERGYQDIDVMLRLSDAQLKTFSIWLYTQVSCGVLEFLIPVLDNNVKKQVLATIQPDTIQVQCSGYNDWVVRFAVESESFNNVVGYEI